MKLNKMAATLAVCAATLSTTAFGSALVNQTLFVPGINEFQDTDAERILRNGTPIVSGNFQVGDVIQTILRFDTINNQSITDLIQVNGGPLPNFYQLTAFSELQVGSIVDVPTLGAGSCAATGFCRLIFTPTGNLSSANSFADLYERDTDGGATNAFSLSVSPTDAINRILAQTFIASVGLFDSDDFWYADTLLDIAAAAALAEGAPQQAAGVFGLSVLANPGLLPVTANAIQSGATGTWHDVVGNVSAYQRSPGVNEGWLVSSNTSLAFTNQVPEPGTLALVGLALAGMGVGAAKRRQR
jgi:hypothetical protein